jgi:hypothetical protein
VGKHCGYLYSREPGSARYRDSAECQLRLYDERIKEIWLAYLTYNGSTHRFCRTRKIKDSSELSLTAKTLNKNG